MDQRYDPKQPSIIGGKAISYGTMATVFLAVNAEADGQIVYTDVDPDLTIMGDTANGSFDIDMDNDGTLDFGLLHFVQTDGDVGAKVTDPSLAGVNRVVGAPGGLGYAYPSALNSGDPISGGVGPWLSWAGAPGGEMSLVFAYAGGNVYGNWSDVSGFVGVEFQSSGNTYYGWIELTVALGGASITIKGYAYESSDGVAIDAGAVISSVPDIGAPGSFTLFPNPVEDLVRIGWNTTDPGPVQVTVLNGMGQELLAQQFTASAGDNTFLLDMSTVAAGTYFLRLQKGDGMVHRKVTKR